MTEPTAWEFRGILSQKLYSPRGDYEGLMLDVDGVPVQFVVDEPLRPQLAALQPGATLRLVGADRPRSPKGPAAHEVYDLIELHGAGKPAKAKTEFSGKIRQLHYAKHGEPNGVLLDNGDFLHTKPGGLKRLGWKVGQRVTAHGRARPLLDGSGHVVEVDID